MRSAFRMMTILLAAAELAAAFFATHSAAADPFRRMCEAPQVEPPNRSIRHLTEPSCTQGTTTRIGLNLNLDGSKFFSSIVESLQSSEYARRNFFTFPLPIYRLEGEEEIVLLRLERERGLNEWRVELTASADALQTVRAPQVSPSLTNSLFNNVAWLFPPDPRPLLRFDEDGLLLPPSSFRLPLPGSDNGRFIEIDFETENGATTQFATPSVVNEIENDGRSCETAYPSHGSCFLSNSARHPEWVSDAQSPYISADRFFVTTDAQRIQGFAADLRSGELATETSDLALPVSTIPPRATQTVQLALQLNRNELIENPFSAVPSEAGHQGPVTRFWFNYFDRVGTVHQASVELSPIGPDRWRWTPTIHVGGLAGALLASVPGAIEAFYNNIGGELLFDAEGILVEVISHPEIDALEPYSQMLIQPSDLYYPFNTFEIEFPIGESHLGDENRALQIKQDGYAPGVIESIDLTPDFEILAQSSNGVKYLLAELAFAERGDSKCRFACSNGRDDDHDGHRDFPEDPGCRSPLDGLETDRAFPCDDGVDNDGDGRTDYPKDPSCDSPFDNYESPADYTLKVVQTRMPRGEDPGHLIVAVIDQGQNTASQVDLAGAQLFTRDGKRLAQHAFEVDVETQRPDLNCDGHEDRLLRFPGTFRKEQLRDLCIYGLASGIVFESCTPIPRIHP